MAVFNPFNQYAADVANGVHNLGSHTLKVMLTNTLPVASNTIKANITEIAGGNGYTLGGETVTISSSSQTAGIYSLIAGSDITWTATGGVIAPFRYVVFYNDTPTSPVDPLIGWLDYGAEVNVQDGEDFLFAINGLALINGESSSV